MPIHCRALRDSDLATLLAWLRSPHVRPWWPADGSKPDGDQVMAHTMDGVKEKYGSYVKGYKQIGNIQKPIYAFIIDCDNVPIGYMQYYNAYDFPRDGYTLEHVPRSLAALDMLIGEATYLNRGMGRRALEWLLNERVYKTFDYALVDPDTGNLAAIRTYEQAGFVVVKQCGKKYWMVASKKRVRLSVWDAVALELAFRKCWLPHDALWVFGSRADLTQKGGDLDLYIETHAHTIDDAFRMKQRFLLDLLDRIGEQKVDIVFNMIHDPKSLPIHQVATTQGVKFL